jgi:alpha-ribazole phosphatase
MIYLIRHTTPAVARGICYGQTDLDVTGSFHEEAELIRQHLPADIGLLYSSPLKRCTLLAQKLFPDRQVHLKKELMEIHCGEWEMRAWDELPPEEVNPWMADFVRVRIPGGESYLDLHQRVTRCWETIRHDQTAGDITVIAHGGVLRSILSGINDTPLIESFATYLLYYGCVIRLFETEGRWRHEVLLNQAPAEKEQHKPKAFYQ